MGSLFNLFSGAKLLVSGEGIVFVSFFFGGEGFHGCSRNPHIIPVDSLGSVDDEKPKVRDAIQERFQVKDVPEFLTKLASRHPLDLDKTKHITDD